VTALKTDAEILAMIPSCRLAADTLAMIARELRVGMSTLEINDRCHEFITKAGAIPAPLNYRGFPKSVCTSINEVVCHGIPRVDEILKEGDIINVDITTILHGYHGDVSATFAVGRVSERAQRLVDITRQCLEAGIAAVRPGARVGDIGYAIQSLAEESGFSVVREYVGHGIGKLFHEDLQIPHYGQRNQGVLLQPGMVFTIEPMINAGRWRTKLLSDGWTAVTADRSLSAQFEHTIAIMNTGEVKILTTASNL
jgi:methionyl aminopeptidase